MEKIILEDYLFTSLKHCDRDALQLLKELSKTEESGEILGNLISYVGRNHAYIVSKEKQNIGFFMYAEDPYNLKNTEIYYAVLKQFQRKGYATAFVKLMCSYLEKMGPLVIKPYSLGGEKVAINCGFEKQENWYYRKKEKVK